ncbi:UNVERIFIED_CONTAM: hypothetical protein FKN15_049761 [Acipenser sinensis]
MMVLILRRAGPSASSQEGAYRQLWYRELSDTYPMGRHIPYIMSLVVVFELKGNEFDTPDLYRIHRV